MLHIWPAGAIAPVSVVRLVDQRRRRTGATLLPWACTPEEVRRAVHAQRREDPRLAPTPTRWRRAAARPPRRGCRSRGWSSGTARRRRAPRPSRRWPRRGRRTSRPPSAPTRGRPARPAARRCAPAATARCGRRTRGRRARSETGSSRDSAPSSTSWRTSTAVKVLVIEPIRYCTSVTSPGTSPYPPDHTSSPSRTTPATTEGSRPSTCRGRPGPAAGGRSRRRPGPARCSRGCSCEGLRRRAGADQVAVAVRLVDPGDRRPVLVGVDAGREDRDLARVGAVPVADQRPRGVRGAAQRRVLGGPLPRARPGRSRRGSRSSRRRTGRSRRGPRTRSARPSACRRPGTTWSARGSRSRSAAWRRRRR